MYMCMHAYVRIYLVSIVLICMYICRPAPCAGWQWPFSPFLKLIPAWLKSAQIIFVYIHMYVPMHKYVCMLCTYIWMHLCIMYILWLKFWHVCTYVCTGVHFVPITYIHTYIHMYNPWLPGYACMGIKSR